MIVTKTRRSTPVLLTRTSTAAASDGSDLETPRHNGARAGAGEQ